MSSRKPPTADELIATLATGLDKPDTALHWGTATGRIRNEWRTTRIMAEAWLADLVTAPDSELLALWPTSGVILQPKRPPGDWTRLRLTNLGWSDAEVMDLRFTVSGHRKPANGEHGASCNDLFVLRRSELKPMRRCIIAEREQRNREQAEQDAAKRVEFRSRHGAALDIITSELARVPLTHEFLRDNMISPRVNNNELAISLHGGPDSLTIDLCGPEIEAFAALLSTPPQVSEVESP
jgi:hypothetical protein